MQSVVVTKALDVIQACAEHNQFNEVTGLKKMIRLIPGAELNAYVALRIRDAIKLFSPSIDFYVYFYGDISLHDLCAYSLVPSENRFIGKDAILSFETSHRTFKDVEFSNFAAYASLDDDVTSRALSAAAMGFNYPAETLRKFAVNSIATGAKELLNEGIFTRYIGIHEPRFNEVTMLDKERTASDLIIPSSEHNWYIDGEITPDVCADTLQWLESVRSSGDTEVTIWFNSPHNTHMKDGMLLASIFESVNLKIVGIAAGELAGGSVMAFAGCNNGDRLTLTNTEFLLSPYKIDQLTSRQSDLLKHIQAGKLWYERLAKFTLNKKDALRDVLNQEPRILGSDIINYGIADAMI